MFYSESLLLSSPYLTHLMRITSKFDLDVIYHPHDTNFPHCQIMLLSFIFQFLKL